MLRFTQKLPEILQIHVCTNHGPQGLCGATIGKTIFTCVLKKSFLQNQLANFNQIWYKSSSGKGPGPLQRGDNHKNAKIGLGHLKILLSLTNNVEKLRFT
jgi:hypothetical protein